MNTYDDLMHLSRVRFEQFPPMSAHDRAAQFSPFAALTGYDDAVSETARLTDRRQELTQDQTDTLNLRLQRLSDILTDCLAHVCVTYFVADKRKAGGSYAVKTGTVRIIDTYENCLVFTDKQRVPIADLLELEIEDEQNGLYD